MSINAVITGVGCIGAYGLGVDALQHALAQGRALTSEISHSEGYHRKGAANLGATCADRDFTKWLSTNDGRRMSDLSQYAVTCARMALANADMPEIPAERTSVTIATAFGPGGFTEKLAVQVLQRGGKFASPFLFTDCVANAAAGQIAIAIGARGPNNTICNREAGPLLALSQAATDIETGRADICLVGAIDEIKPLTHSILGRFRALARPLHGDSTDSELPRPFDTHRNGYLAGEGGTVLVLEREDHATSRGARIYARVGPTVRAFDPTASRVGHGTDSQGLAERLCSSMGTRLRDVDAVVSSASGSRRGDALEAEILRLAVPHKPHVVAPKAVTGEFGGGTLAAAALAMSGCEFAMPQGCSTADPKLDINLYHGQLAAKRLLCSAHGAGGVSAWTLLEQP
jgi:3-oxoacyl-[acyl-carrier-protein] synthase II